MSLPDEMRQLTEHFLKAHEDRMMAVAGIRVNTATEIAGFQEARQAMSVQQQQQLNQYLGKLEADVGMLRRDATAFLKEQDAAHQVMAVQQQQQLTQEHIRLAAETKACLGDLSDARQTMAGQQQQQLKDSMDRLGQDVSALRSETTAFHRAMAVKQNQQLTEGHVALSAETAAFLNAVDTAHQTMTSEQRQRLSIERTRLATEVAEMRGNLQAAQNQSRHIWNEFILAVQHHHAGEPSPASSPLPPDHAVPVEAQSAEKIVPEPASPDDLTVIQGIGVGMQKKLNEAGVYTLAQLAAGTPEGLREVLGEARQLAKVENWIEQARELQKG